jgi:hypothetical protein
VQVQASWASWVLGGANLQVAGTAHNVSAALSRSMYAHTAFVQQTAYKYRPLHRPAWSTLPTGHSLIR